MHVDIYYCVFYGVEIDVRLLHWQSALWHQGFLSHN